MCAGDNEPAAMKRAGGKDRRKEANQMSMKKELSLEELKQIVGGVEDPIISMTVTWEDANGNRFSYTVGGEKPKTYDPIVSQTVTWEDGNGTTYSTTCVN